MGNRNSGIIANLDNMPPEQNRNVVSGLMELNSKGRPQTDDEVEERLNEYFEYCAVSGMRPGMETMCLALHINRSTFFRWEKGLRGDERRREIALNARQMLAAYWEQASMRGMINPATSCFMAKNWFGYQDQTVVIHESDGEKQVLSASELPKLSAQSKVVEGDYKVVDTEGGLE